MELAVSDIRRLILSSVQHLTGVAFRHGCFCEEDMRIHLASELLCQFNLQQNTAWRIYADNDVTRQPTGLNTRWIDLVLTHHGKPRVLIELKDRLNNRSQGRDALQKDWERMKNAARIRTEIECFFSIVISEWDVTDKLDLDAYKGEFKCIAMRAVVQEKDELWDEWNRQHARAKMNLAGSKKYRARS